MAGRLIEQRLKFLCQCSKNLWWTHAENFKMMSWLLFELWYLLEIFSICSSHVCANLRKKFWPLLNQPASHGPFWPKLWMSLATVFVEIFQKEKNWWGSRPIWVTWWKEFSISFKKWRFEFFCRAKASTFTMSTGTSTLSMSTYSKVIGCQSLRSKIF